MRVDARIPVLILPEAVLAARAAGPADPDPWSVLVRVADGLSGLPGPDPEGWAAVRRLAPDAVAPPGPHRPGCVCCAGRAPLALLLSDLFRQRATGELILFRRVVLVLPDAARQAALDLLDADPLTAGRFRREAD